jgi:PAS domain S-box-containing protein
MFACEATSGLSHSFRARALKLSAQLEQDHRRGSRVVPLGADWPIISFIVLALLALAAAATSATRSAGRFLDAESARAGASLRLRQWNQVLDAVIDEQTGARGYIVSGDSTFLVPYESGQLRQPLEMAALEALYVGDSAWHPTLTRVREAVEEHGAHHATLVAVRREQGFAAAQAVVRDGHGKQLSDSIRAIVGVAIDEEERRLAEQGDWVRVETRAATRDLIILFGVSLALFILAILGLWRENRRRRASNAEVRELNRTLESRIAEIRTELEQSEGRLQRALDDLFEGCSIHDADLRYRYVNRSAAKQGRSTVEEMMGRTMSELYPGFETTELYAAMRRTLDLQVAQTVELEFPFPDGTVGWFEIQLQPIADGIFALSHETTERVHAARALQASEGRVRALLEGLPEQVFLLDRNGVVLELHVPDAARVWQPPEQMRRRPLVASLPDAAAEILRGAIDRATADASAQTVQYEIALEEGPHQFEAIVVPTYGDRLTVVARDITARQQLEHQLRQAQKMEAVGQLTGGIAHDFNNVLTVIGVNAELLSVAQSDGREKSQELEEIVRATRRGAEMIAQLLSFSRRGNLKRQPVVISAVIRSFSGMLQRLLPATIRLEFGAQCGTELVRLDSGALEQVLANLCTNARDAMPTGGVIRLDCELTHLDVGYHATHPWVVPGTYVCVSVSDTGVGMDERTRSRIFEPFYTTKPSGVGTGLGMSMVYGIMKEHEGMVHVYSELGHGTVIKLFFPVSRGTPMAGTPVVGSSPAGIGGGAETILLAEDEPSIRLATRRALESKGYTVLDAPDGEQALALFHAHRARISLIISDLVMPNLGGRQLVEALRAEGETIPVLFTSGYSAESIASQGELPKGVAFLHKPWVLADLFTRVRGILDGTETLS